jgi:hypothetical protein
MSLARLKIPERYKPGIAALARLSEPSYQEILAAVKRAPKSLASSRDFEAWLMAEVKSVLAEDLRRLTESIASLYWLPSKFKRQTSKLASEILDSARESISGFEIAEGTDFVNRLTALLQVESFGVIAFKAKELQEQAERTYCDARILTDIRPVFREKVENAPSGMVIVHTLKLVVHEAAGHKDFFVALDEDDIESLKETLVRAEQKAKALKDLLKSKEMHLIDLSRGGINGN